MYDNFLERLLETKPGDIIKIHDKDSKILFMASYYTEHFPEDEYLKVFMSDGTILEVMPQTKELYFCDDNRRNINRSLISDDGKSLNIDGKKYILQDGNNRQYIKKLYYGNVEDGEEGCIFSDFIYGDEVWSLAVLDNNQISDVHARKITAEECLLV